MFLVVLTIVPLKMVVQLFGVVEDEVPLITKVLELDKRLVLAVVVVLPQIVVVVHLEKMV